MGKLEYGLVLVGIGIVLFAERIVIGYLAGVSLEHIPTF
jgi:hypothetical protein